MRTDVITTGKSALARINERSKTLISDWVKVGAALKAGKEKECGNDTRKFGDWLAQHFPELAGDAKATTRGAAMWLVDADARGDLQEFQVKEGINHPVAVKAAVKEAKRAKQGEVAISKTRKASKVTLLLLPAPQPQDTSPKDAGPEDTSSVAFQGAETPPAAPVEVEASAPGQDASAATVFDYAPLRAKVDAAMGWVREVSDFVSTIVAKDAGEAAGALANEDPAKLKKLADLVARALESQQAMQPDASAALMAA